MVRQFVWCAGIVAGLSGMAILHYIYVQYSRPYEKISDLVSLTKVSSPSNSSAYYEPRVFNEDVIHPAYPQMQTIDRTDFVYVR